MGKLVNKKAENGFSALEALLIVVIVGIVGFTGWYVWHVKQSTDKTLTADNSNVPSFKKSATATGSLTITRNNPLHQPNASVFTVHITDQATVNKLYQDLQHLPTFKSVFGSGPVNCPEDDGISYSMLFTSPTLKATVDASGCESVELSTSKTAYTTWARGKSIFLTDLSAATKQPIDPSKVQ